MVKTWRAIEIETEYCNHGKQSSDLVVAFSTCTVLVGLDDGCIQKQLVQFRIQTEYTENIIQNSILNPFAETAVYRIPGAITLWKIAPGGTASGNPDHGVYH